MNFLRKLQPTDKVLILGEGNFSFATSLLQSLLDHSNDCDIASIVATCLEPFSEEFSVGKKRNIAYLKKKGMYAIRTTLHVCLSSLVAFAYSRYVVEANLPVTYLQVLRT